MNRESSQTAKGFLSAIHLLAHEKNIDFLVRVVDALRRTHPRALLVIAGEGPAQRSLLDLVAKECDTELDEAPPVTDCSEWPERQRLKYEKEALGFYISGHPLARYARIIARMSARTTATLWAMMRA